MASERLSWVALVAVMATTSVQPAMIEVKTRTLLASATTSFSVDLRGVEFKAGRPIKGEGLAASMKAPTDVSYQLLDEAIDTLKRNPEIRISVNGYANDEEGSIGERQLLSERRAELVFDYLISHEVPPNQLRGWKGFGSASPIDSDETGEGRQRNSRVELAMSGD